MAKRSRKPQGQPIAASTSEPAVSSLSSVSHDQAGGFSTDSSRKWWHRFYDNWIELVTGGLVVLFVSLWVSEFREHESTKAQLARAEESRQQAEDGKKQATSERDQSRKDLKDLLKENAELKKLHPILELYGSHTKFTASYDLPKEFGSILRVGKCPATPCLEVKLRAINIDDNGIPAAFLGVGGIWEGFQSPDHSVVTHVTTRRGCKSIFEAGKYRVTIVIEEENFTSIKVGIAAIIIDPLRSGFKNVKENECRER